MLMVLAALMSTSVKTVVVITAMLTLVAPTSMDHLNVPVMADSPVLVPSVKTIMSVIYLTPVQLMPLAPTLMVDLNALARMVSAEVLLVTTLTNVRLELITATPMLSVPTLLDHSSATV